MQESVRIRNTQLDEFSHSEHTSSQIMKHISSLPESSVATSQHDPVQGQSWSGIQAAWVSFDLALFL